jgi:hypothetical protein
MKPQINQTSITIGAARREGRAASHDGEYISLAWDDHGHWLIEDSAGVVADSERGETYLDACGEEATEEDEQIQQEIEGYLATCPQPGKDTAGLGGQAKELARYWGWPIANA